jgi:hypothetical protein
MLPELVDLDASELDQVMQVYEDYLGTLTGWIFVN